MNRSDDMTLTQMVEAIAQHEVFRDLQPDALMQLQEIVELVTVTKDEVIFNIDDQPDSVLFLVQGSLSLYFPDNTKLELQECELIGEIGVLNGDFRLGTLIANQDSKLIAINGPRLFDPKYIRTDISLSIVRKLSKRVTNYLKSIQQTSTNEIIQSGENEKVEFKSTLRWNLKADKKDNAITHAVLKTIAGFLNTEGGILLVGVEDDGTVLGLESDKFESEDKMLLFLTSSIKSKLGITNVSSIHYHIEKHLGKGILRVDVAAGHAPCYVSDGNREYFYIRTGPSTTELDLSKVYNYIKRRFFNDGKSTIN